MYKHDQRLIWGSGSQHGGCLAPSLLGFWGSQPKELQKRCWNSHSRWKANPIPVALPLLAACCCFCSHFSTPVSLADAIPKNRGTSSTWLVALRRGFCSPDVLRAQWFPAKTMLFCHHQGEGMGSSEQEGACCACQPCFSMSFMHRCVPLVCTFLSSTPPKVSAGLA